MMNFHKMSVSGSICAALLLVGAPTAALAKEPAKKASVQRAEEVSATARLNAEQAAKAKAEADAYQARVGAVVATEQRNEAVFENATAAYEQDKAATAQHAAAERLQWEADVKACEAGDKTRCAAPSPE